MESYLKIDGLVYDTHHRMAGGGSRLQLSAEKSTGLDWQRSKMIVVIDSVAIQVDADEFRRMVEAAWCLVKP